VGTTVGTHVGAGLSIRPCFRGQLANRVIADDCRLDHQRKSSRAGVGLIFRPNGARRWPNRKSEKCAWPLRL